MKQRTTLARRLAAGVAALALGLALSGCQFFEGGAVPSAEGTPSNGADAATAPAATGTTVPNAARATTAPSQASEAADEASGQAGATNVAVSPGEVAVGNAVLTFAVQPAQAAYDPAAQGSAPADGDGQQRQPEAKGYAVLGGAALKVTNNFDPAQRAPADQPQEIIRHLALQVKDKESGQIIPHVEVTLDLLREGRSVLQDQPLVPMVETGGGVAQLHYGNNVKFPGKGEYQVFVRMRPSPLLGQAGVAQFNVSIR